MTDIALVAPDHPALSKVADPVEAMYTDTPEGRLFIQRLSDQMHEFLLEPSDVRAAGIGLAAPQLGLNLRMFIMNYGGRPSTFINPEITFCDRKKGQELAHEGCLSFPEFGTANIERWKRIKVSYINTKGETKKHYMQGLMARIFQHELDHLNGVTIKDHDEERREALNYHV